jgi:hypothetical protein
VPRNHQLQQALAAVGHERRLSENPGCGHPDVLDTDVGMPRQRSLVRGRRENVSNRHLRTSQAITKFATANVPEQI